MMKNRILIIGDSYAAAGRGRNRFSNNFPYAPYFSYPDDDPVNNLIWTSILQDHYACDMTICAYGGQSWWFSYQMFEEWKRLCPSNWKETDVVIFLHTHYCRLNSSNDLILEKSNSVGATNTKKQELEMIFEAKKSYDMFLSDKKFHIWCQNRFFHMLPTIFSGKKLINLSCFMDTIEFTDFLNIPMGTVVGTDLDTISFNEFIKRPMMQGFWDDRPCHLSPENHRILADYLIKFIDDYRPGIAAMPAYSFRQRFL